LKSTLITLLPENKTIGMQNNIGRKNGKHFIKLSAVMGENNPCFTNERITLNVIIEIATFTKRTNVQ
jgi:hypothetical protein